MLDNIWHLDAYQLYDTPTEVSQSLFGVAAGTQIIPPDPSRVLLVCNYAGSIMSMSTNSGPYTTLQGMQFGNAMLPLVLNWEKHGPLVTSAWFLVQSDQSTFTWFGVSLQRNPEIYGYPHAYIDRTAAGLSASVVRKRGASLLGANRQPAVLPRALRERLPGILGTE